MNLKSYVQEVAQSAKVALGVGTATTSAGTASMLEWIPDDIGKLASLVGIALSVVLIYTHLRKGGIEYRKTQLEILILKKMESDRIEAARGRKEAGEPTRRAEDADA